MSELPVIYNKSLLSYANTHITNPVTFAWFLAKGQMMIEMAESKVRVQARCRQLKEEIMMRAWCPERVEKLLHLGYDIEEM